MNWFPCVCVYSTILFEKTEQNFDWNDFYGKFVWKITWKLHTIGSFDAKPCVRQSTNENNSKFSAITLTNVHNHLLTLHNSRALPIHNNENKHKLFHRFLYFSFSFSLFRNFSRNFSLQMIFTREQTSKYSIENIYTFCEKRMVCHKYRRK